MSFSNWLVPPLGLTERGDGTGMGNYQVEEPYWDGVDLISVISPSIQRPTTLSSRPFLRPGRTLSMFGSLVPCPTRPDSGISAHGLISFSSRFPVSLLLLSALLGWVGGTIAVGIRTLL